jgi:hypothetical protein
MPEADKPTNTPPVNPPAQTPPVAPPVAPIVPPVVEDDPMIKEYADTLKQQVGDMWEKEDNKLPVKEQIIKLKIIKKTMDKMPARSEGKPPIAPEPEGLHTKVKNHVERWNAGEKGFVQSSVFSIKENK